MDTPAAHADETRNPRRYLCDLAALTALSPGCSDRRRIADEVAGFLVRVLHLDVAHVRLAGSAGQDPAFALRFEEGPAASAWAAWVERTLSRSSSSTRALSLPHPLGDGQVYAAVVPIGREAELGLMLAASRRPQFPTDEARLLLDVVANHLAVVLQHLRAEAALVRSEANLNDFFDNAVVGMHCVGPDGTVLRVNQAELALLGYDREDFVGHSITDFHADRKVIDDMLRRLHAGEALREVEARLRCKDGSIKHVIINSNVLWEGGRFVHTRCSVRDVTEQKRAEAALRRSEAQVRLVVDRAPLYLARFDRSGRFQFVNRRYAERLGAKPEDLIGRHVEEVLGREAYEAIRGYIDTVLSGWRVEYEIEVPYKGLGRRAMHCTYEPERNDSGEVESFIAIVADLTERRHADAARALLAAVVESSNDAIVTKTLDGRILSWNTGAERLFGHSSSEAIGQSITLVIPPDRQDEEHLILERLGRGERIEQYETERVTKEGRRISISLMLSPLRDGAGRIVGASKIARDITARRQAEDALRRSEGRFRLMAETMPSMLWMAAPDGTMTYANERCLTYSGAALEPNVPGWLDLMLHPEDRGRWVEAWTRALQEGSECEIEVRVRRVDGVYRWFVTRVMPLRDAAGSIVQWFGAMADIHDRKRA